MKELNIIVVDSFFRRLVGFIGRKSIKSNESLFFPHCSRIHTYFMSIPIDIVFIDHNNKVIKVFSSFQPWRVSPKVKGAVACLEMASGNAESLGIKQGMQIMI